MEKLVAIRASGPGTGSKMNMLGVIVESTGPPLVMTRGRSSSWIAAMQPGHEHEQDDVA